MCDTFFTEGGEGIRRPFSSSEISRRGGGERGEIRKEEEKRKHRLWPAKCVALRNKKKGGGRRKKGGRKGAFPSQPFLSPKRGWKEGKERGKGKTLQEQYSFLTFLDRTGKGRRKKAEGKILLYLSTSNRKSQEGGGGSAEPHVCSTAVMAKGERNKKGGRRGERVSPNCGVCGGKRRKKRKGKKTPCF